MIAYQCKLFSLTGDCLFVDILNLVGTNSFDGDPTIDKDSLAVNFWLIGIFSLVADRNGNFGPPGWSMSMKYLYRLFFVLRVRTAIPFSRSLRGS